VTAHPPYADDWAALASVAERLRDDRLRDDPQHVANDRLTAQQAADRARRSTALAQQWRAIADRKPMPWLDASEAEIRDDLEAAVAATAKRAASDPSRLVQLGRRDVPYSAFAKAVAALSWWQRPYRDGATMPLIVFIHSVNQIMRAEQAARPSQPEQSVKPAPRPLPPAPPLRQAALI